MELIGALERFDPSRGVKFSTFMARPVWGAMQDYLRSLDFVPRYVRKRHKAGEMLALRRRLLRAPGRVADAAGLLLQEEPFDLAWLTFCAAHVAGHQLFDLSQIDGVDADAELVLRGALDEVYEAVDAAIGRVVRALPAETDLMVISPVGISARLRTTRVPRR